MSELDSEARRQTSEPAECKKVSIHWTLAVCGGGGGGDGDGGGGGGGIMMYVLIL